MKSKQPKSWVYGKSQPPKDWYQLSQVLQSLSKPKRADKKDEKK